MNHLFKRLLTTSQQTYTKLFVDSMIKETLVEFADSFLHFRDTMRNISKVFVWRLRREARATSIIYQLGPKPNASDLENKFIIREEIILKSLERIKTQNLTY